MTLEELKKLIANDVERLDPANGFPLVVHLDALFDAGLISFDSDGSMMISPRLGDDAITLYGLSRKMRLRNPPTGAKGSDPNAANLR